VRKTELVNSMLVEYTTGMETINKLIAEGLVVERADASDRRAKLISISKKGAKVLTECYPYLARVSRMMLKDVDPDGLRLCVRVLSNVELAHSRLAIEMKNRDFDEIYDRIMNAPSA
jgi:DNA-binding MarR family transcriptional regulator